MQGSWLLFKFLPTKELWGIEAWHFHSFRVYKLGEFQWSMNICWKLHFFVLIWCGCTNFANTSYTHIVCFVCIVHVTFSALLIMFKQYCEYCLQCPRHYCGHSLQRLPHTANMYYDVSNILVPAMFITNTEYCIQCLLHIVNSSNKVYAKFLVSLNSWYRIVEIDFIVNGILQIQTTMFITYSNCCLKCSKHIVNKHQCLCMSYNARHIVKITYISYDMSVLLKVS